MDITNRTISTILKHDSKQTSYKVALLRSINDVVLSFPDVQNQGLDVAIPLRMLAQFWLAYYWPFVDPHRPIMQGTRANRNGKLSSDMEFRESLSRFRQLWETQWGGSSNPADGFFVIDEIRVTRNRNTYSPELIKALDKTLSQIAKAIHKPIQHAGPGQWEIFDKPRKLADLDVVTPIPGAQLNDTCLVIPAELWRAFRELSLWVEALCIHEWCLFTERVDQPPTTKIDRGIVYMLLTARPDNRRPLTWERNQIDILLMEGKAFICPWSQQRIVQDTKYDLDHLVPISIYPINELWNLVPSNPRFNSHKKRDRLPSESRLREAEIHLARAYEHYLTAQPLSAALQADVAARFVDVPLDNYPTGVAAAATGFIRAISASRNVAHF